RRVRACERHGGATPRPRRSPGLRRAVRGPAGRPRPREVRARATPSGRRVAEFELLGQRTPCRFGGLLLAFLLGRAAAAAEVTTADVDRRGELLAVVGTGVLDLVLGHAETGGRGQFLQAGLPVEAGAAQRCLLE